jgi:hypothetical protein
VGTVSDLVAEIQASGFDVTPQDALRLLDRRHKLMLARSRWVRRPLDLLTEGAGSNGATAMIALPAVIVEVLSLTVYGDNANDALALYHRTRFEDFPAMIDGTLLLGGRGGVFVEIPVGTETDSPGSETMKLAIYPGVADGTSVLADCVLEPQTLTTDEADGAGVWVPADIQDALLAGVYSSLLNRPNEARPDLAQAQESIFGAGCEELRDRARRRYRTKGPRQIRVGGVDA